MTDLQCAALVALKQHGELHLSDPGKFYKPANGEGQAHMRATIRQLVLRDVAEFTDHSETVARLSARLRNLGKPPKLRP
ncbi:MAG: hypothetical protein NW206_19595 [Hyphomonadaceae bacterium]|nr:hypothetical protein [Hyphomonadaceae bacterium]